MNFARSLLMGGFFAVLLAGVSLPASADGGTHLIAGTRFVMEVPNCWNTGYKDVDDKLFMIFFKDPKSGAALEGVYLRGTQPASFKLADFKKARVNGENKRYDGKGHKVTKESDAVIAGEKGQYLHTTWKDGGKDMEKHTTLYLKDGNRYLVVMSGEKGKVDKKVFDHAVKSFAVVKP